jgi:hypothetical protein
MSLRIYRQVAFASWDCAIGHADPVPHRHILPTLLSCVAESCWRRLVAAGVVAGIPAWSVNLSKGDVWALDAALHGDPRSLVDAMPGSAGLALARSLGLGLVRPIPVTAACSTGLYGLLGVADAVEDRQASSGLTAAADGPMPDWLHAGFSRMGVLSGQACPPTAVDDGAGGTGFRPGTGAAAIGLAASGPWRLQAGVRAGDARHETQFVDPATMQHALAALWSVAPHPQVIIAHGTGTTAGDAYETTGLEAGPWRSCPRWCLKPGIGHTLGASGLVELAWALDQPWTSLWKISLGFGGHLAAVACRRV